MDEFDVSELYRSLGIRNHVLKNLKDLKRAHKINVNEISGYASLDYFNQKKFERFIVNFYNFLGLQTRTELFPEWVGFVEEIRYTALKPINGQYEPKIVGAEYYQLVENQRIYYTTWGECISYKGLKCTPQPPNRFLRFDYKRKGKQEWLHVLTPTSWR